MRVRPLIVAGNGIRLAGEVERFAAFVQDRGVPFVTTWTGADLMPTDELLNIGILGMSGQAGANRAVQECDYLLALGTHLAIPHTSTLTDKFAPNAIIDVVNIDADQLKHMNVRVDESRHMTLREYFDDPPSLPKPSRAWLDRCTHYKALCAVGEPYTLNGINSYAFNQIMTRMLPAGTCMVIDGGGTALYTGFQSSHVKAGSRLICSTAMSAMGSGLPEAVGACFANWRMLTTCLIGDGSLMLNVQELQTIRHHDLPIKVFVLNNRGYLAIRDTQDSFLGKRHNGVGGADDPSLSFPEVARIAAAFKIPFYRVTKRAGAEEVIGMILDQGGPTICEVQCPQDQKMRWRQGFAEVDGKMVPQTLDNMVESP